MTEEQKKKRLEELNQKCVECRTRSKFYPPTFERCNYHCTIGAQIHKLDFEAKGGWGSHSYWNKN